MKRKENIQKVTIECEACKREITYIRKGRRKRFGNIFSNMDAGTIILWYVNPMDQGHEITMNICVDCTNKVIAALGLENSHRAVYRNIDLLTEEQYEKEKIDE